MKRGFTLLEVTVASVVLAIAIMATVAAISINFRLQRSNQETMIAMNAANEQINRFMTDPYMFRTLNTPGAPLLNQFPVAGLNLQDADVAAGNLAGEIEIETFGVVPGLPPAGIDYFRIAVIVRWQGVSGEREIVLYSQRYRLLEDAAMQLVP